LGSLKIWILTKSISSTLQVSSTRLEDDEVTFELQEGRKGLNAVMSNLPKKKLPWQYMRKTPPHGGVFFLTVIANDEYIILAL
jgi:hypothetical protein